MRDVLRNRLIVIGHQQARPVTRDPRKSTLNKPLKFSWSGLFSFSPIGC